MRKLLLLMFALLTSLSGAWAQSKISKAVAGTYLFDSSNPALTVKKEGASIWTNKDGSIAMGHNDLSTVTGSRTYAAVVMRVNMPTTAPAIFSNFINLKNHENNSGSIGLGVTTEGKLKGTWEGNEWNGNLVTSSAVTGEHTIVLLCNNDGTTIYVDNANTSVNKPGLKCSTKWDVLRIEKGYVSCVKSVYVFSGEQKDNIAAFFSELSNVVTVANGETKSVSENSSGTRSRFFVASGGTLTVDAAYDLDKIEGAGNVTLGADATISGNKSTVATGKLTINEGKTLTIGEDDDETNSIASFSSIDLSGTIKNKNSTTTLNNVTVPADKTGKIFAFDMGSSADGFKLAGTTTLKGNLTICSKWNAQIKVDELAGSGTWLICGTTGDTFDDTQTSSSEAATINITSASSYTGNVTVNNSQATVNLSGNLIVNALSGSGTLNVASGSTITAPSVPRTMTLTGAGVVVLTSFPTSSAPTLSSWTGTVQFPDGGSNSTNTNLEAIFNAWGNTNSTIKLNNVSGGYLGKDGTVNPTLNILSGKTLTLDNGYSNSNSTITRVTGAGTLDRKGWSGSNNHNLNITTLTDFTGTLKGTGHPIIVKKLVVASAPYANGLLIKTSGDVRLEQLYVGLEPTTAYTWETKTVKDVEGIYVDTFNEVQLRREMAAATVSPYFNHIGTGVGEYTISLGLNEKYTSIPEFTDAIVAWSELSDCSTPIVTINQPTSAFYRIKSDDNKYLQDVRKSDSETQRTLTDAKGADEAAETIFYLNSNTLVGYKTGYGFGFSVCQTQDTEHLNSMLFTESTETGMGKYTIQSQQGTYASAKHNEGYWGVDGSDLSRENDAASGACWTLEEVTSLPVTITKYGMRTFSAPVALTIPSGVQAYTVSISGTDVTLTEVETTIPANTPVILYNHDVEWEGDAVTGTEQTYYFAIDKENTASKPACVLSSIFATKAKGDNDLTLQYDLDNKVFGFWQASGDNIKGFSAYLEWNSDSNVRRFVITTPSTGIESVQETPMLDKNIYDVQGRRVGKATKGLYIINGKKVIL